MEAHGHPRAVAAIALSALAGGAVWFALTADGSLGDGLFFVLLGVTILAVLLVTSVEGVLVVSATFTSSMLAVAFLGPAAAFAIVVVAEVLGWAIERYRPLALSTTVRPGCRFRGPSSSSSL